MALVPCICLCDDDFEMGMGLQIFFLSCPVLTCLAPMMGYFGYGNFCIVLERGWD